jgi:signal transduction histidine kinase
MRFSAASLVLATLTSLSATAQAPAPTPAQAEKLVQAAVAYAKQNGIEKLIQQTNQADGRFHVGAGSQLYIFIYDLNGVCKGIGFNSAAIVGVNRWDLKDPDGKFFIREIVATAKNKGKGWVDYKYPNPQSGKVDQKTSYVEMFEGAIIGSGIYK